MFKLQAGQEGAAWRRGGEAALKWQSCYCEAERLTTHPTSAAASFHMSLPRVQAVIQCHKPTLAGTAPEPRPCAIAPFGRCRYCLHFCCRCMQGRRAAPVPLCCDRLPSCAARPVAELGRPARRCNSSPLQQGWGGASCREHDDRLQMQCTAWVAPSKLPIGVQSGGGSSVRSREAFCFL